MARRRKATITDYNSKDPDRVRRFADDKTAEVDRFREENNLLKETLSAPDWTKIAKNSGAQVGGLGTQVVIRDLMGVDEKKATAVEAAIGTVEIGIGMATGREWLIAGGISTAGESIKAGMRKLGGAARSLLGKDEPDAKKGATDKPQTTTSNAEDVANDLASERARATAEAKEPVAA